MTDPAATPPAPRTSGKKGCLLAFALFASLGAGSLVLSKFLFDRKNANILEGARALADVIQRASEAPGASDVHALGCETAGVLSTPALHDLAQHLEEEAARTEKRAPREVDLGARDPVAFCAHPATGEPSCAKVAAAYLRGTKPEAPFVVTVRTGFRETCVERFDPAGTSLGAAPSPRLPLLVAPR